ncbi:MAG: sulfatase-like hydrolase/transferase, partial [Phycisphaerales bacterium]
MFTTQRTKNDNGTVTRRRFLKALGWATALPMLSATSSRSARKKIRPNILFIMVDDLGKEWISCYGAGDIETPNIDALAKTGMRFENAYSMPQCTPSRVALLT